MGLAVLRKSRRRPKPGDVFALRPARGTYLFGRVVRTDANAGGFPNANLIYIYRARSASKTRVPALHRDDLLLPPLMTNCLPWFRGYFEHIAHSQLSPKDCLPRHAFRDDRGWLFDECGTRIRRGREPVGDWALHSYLTIDEEVSLALGVRSAIDE